MRIFRWLAVGSHTIFPRPLRGQRRAAALAIFLALIPLSAYAADLPAGFVCLTDIDPTIGQDIRYAGSANFLGRIAKGYEAPACILTKQAAEALAKVQKTLAAEKLTLVVFDCYRPKRAVEDFVGWVREGGAPDPLWHPNVQRGDLIRQGYIASRSGHSRGSTVDIAMAPLDSTKNASDPQCGAQNAGTLDFGTGFDCLDPKSATAHTPLSAEAAANRKRLVEAMKAQGFRNYAAEWWHFTLTAEPFSKQRFDFPITAQ